MHQRGFGGPRGWFPITGSPNIVSIVQILRLSSRANPAPVLASPWPAKTVSVRQKPNRVNPVNLVNPAHEFQDTDKADASLRFAPLVLSKILGAC